MKDLFGYSQTGKGKGQALQISQSYEYMKTPAYMIYLLTALCGSGEVDIV